MGPMKLRSVQVSACLFFALSATLLAQQAVQPVPGPQLVPTPGIPGTGFTGLDGYRARRIAVFTDDYGQLQRYRDANASLGAPAPSENRVVFFGDSITDIWKLADYFPGKPYINRGIGGQTTPQMLVRFRQDVIDLHPKVVVILAGTNDIAGNAGPATLAQIEGNLESLCELARAHEVRVVVASILPVSDDKKDAGGPIVRTVQRPPATILELNRWLAGYAAANGHVYLDYFTAMADGNGRFRPDLNDDGLHPNASGYAVMAPLAEKAIAAAAGSR